MSRLVIKEHRPLKPWLYFGGSVLLFVVALVAMVDYAEWRFLLGTMSLAGEQQKAIGDNLKLRKENQRLRTSVEQLRRGAEVDLEARRASQQMIADLERRAAETQRELRFYQDVLKASESDKPPSIAGARISRRAAGDQYLLSVILSHTKKGARKGLKGRLTGELLTGGTGANGNPLPLDLTQLVRVPERLEFDFKTFALIELELNLPPTANPETLELRLQGADGNLLAERAYPWAQLMR